MEAIRKVVTSISEDLIIKLPEEFRNRKLEVIILPSNEEDQGLKKKERLLKIYNESKGVLPEGYRIR